MARRVALLLAAFVAMVGILPVGAPGLAAAGAQPRVGDAAMALEVNTGSVIRLNAPATAVFVANPEVADVQMLSPTLVSVFGRGAGETTLFAVDGGDRVLLNRRVMVTHNLGRLNQAIGDLLPRSSIQAQSVQGGILLTGSVSSPEQAEDARRLAAHFVKEEKDVINRIRIEGPTQIHLRVRVAEVSKQVSKQFGINWEAIARPGDFAFGLATGKDIQFDADTGSVIRTPGADNILAQLQSSRFNVNVLVDALAEEGLITLLAEPSLTAMSGETASFLAGGEFPIPLTSRDGDITVEFKQFGVSLAFTPTVIGEGRVNLKVRPEVSQLSSAGAVRIGQLEIPALTSRRAETTVELGSGQSFAVAGLLQNNANQNVSKFPILGDLPVLGALFRSTRFQRDESELVIIVTPYLVEPVSTRLALPTDGFVAPDEIERVGEGRLVDRSAKALTKAVPHAPVGYVVE